MAAIRTLPVVFGCILIFASAVAYVSEIFLEEEEPADTHLTLERAEKSMGTPCRITIPKTLLGRCKQLGRSGAVGCVAGHYIDPLHANCQ